MAAKNNVLGRGLGNLIGSGNKTTLSNLGSGGEDVNAGVREIKISEIKVNPNQPRKFFNPESISQLAETIKLHGVIQPVIVKKLAEGFELVAGERRLRACKEAGLVKIPAIIKNYNEKDSLEIALLENIQREDLNPIEEAAAYQQLSEKLGLKTSEIAARVGKNRSTVANLIRLLQLPDSVKQLVASRKLSEGQARPLLSIADKRKLEETAHKIIDQGMTAREVEDYVSKLLGETRQTRSSKTLSKVDPSILEVESKIRNKFSTKVSVSHNESTGRGKIIFFYSSLDEMERIIEKMGIK